MSICLPLYGHMATIVNVFLKRLDKKRLLRSEADETSRGQTYKAGEVVCETAAD